MTPETSSTPVRPMAMPTAARPCSASASLRDRGPGSITAQPSRSPVPAATKTAVSSSRPVRCDQAEDVQPAVGRHQPGGHGHVHGVGQQARITGRPRKTPRTRAPAATHALLVHTWAAKEPAGFAE